VENPLDIRGGRVSGRLRGSGMTRADKKGMLSWKVSIRHPLSGQINGEVVPIFSTPESRVSSPKCQPLGGKGIIWSDTQQIQIQMTGFIHSTH
jgi:hypothetical protein